MAPHQTGAAVAWWATNSAVMAVLTALIVAEQSLPAGRRSGHLAAAVPIVDGVVVLRAPAAQPSALCGVPGVAGAATRGAPAARRR